MRYAAVALLAAMAAPAAAQDTPEPPTPASIIAAAPGADWRAIDPADLMVMTLAPDRDGNPRQVTIQLLPPPFSQPWVDNIRTLARSHWWDGTAVYRVVDNWVTQWGGGDTDLGMEPGPMPEGLVSPVAPYTSPAVPLTRVLPDNYASGAGFVSGWPIAYQADAAGGVASTWPIHCYGHVGVARDIETTGTGSELYAVIGHAPRQLDRIIAVVGRVIEGIEHLSVLPRGKGDAGVYDDPALRVPILSVRMGDEIAEPPRFQYLGTETDSFAQYAHLRANRSDAFYTAPAGGVDVCNVPVPIRPVPAG